MTTENKDGSDYWNGPQGQNWVRFQEEFLRFVQRHVEQNLVILRHADLEDIGDLERSDRRRRRTEHGAQSARLAASLEEGAVIGLHNEVS